METLQQLHWQEFVSSQNLPNLPEGFTQAVHVVCDNKCLDAILDEPIFNEIYSEILHYHEFTSCKVLEFIHRNGGTIAPVIYMSNT